MKTQVTLVTFKAMIKINSIKWWSWKSKSLFYIIFSKAYKIVDIHSIIVFPDWLSFILKPEEGFPRNNACVII